MTVKFVILATILAYVNAGNLVSYAAPAPPAFAYSAPIAKTVYPAPAPFTYAAPIAKTVYSAPAPVAYSAPVAKAVVAARAEDYDPNPQYSYGYDIQDGLTGDSKSQSETRNGDVVQGTYSVVDPDGTKRTVEYTADPVHGFNAVVHREPLGAPAIAKVATPVAKVHAAPIAYSASPAYGYAH